MKIRFAKKNGSWLFKPAMLQTSPRKTNTIGCLIFVFTLLTLVNKGRMVLTPVGLPRWVDRKIEIQGISNPFELVNKLDLQNFKLIASDKVTKRVLKMGTRLARDTETGRFVKTFLVVFEFDNSEEKMFVGAEYAPTEEDPEDGDEVAFVIRNMLQSVDIRDMMDFFHIDFIRVGKGIEGVRFDRSILEEMRRDREKILRRFKHVNRSELNRGQFKMEKGEKVQKTLRSITRGRMEKRFANKKGLTGNVKHLKNRFKKRTTNVNRKDRMKDNQMNNKNRRIKRETAAKKVSKQKRTGPKGRKQNDFDHIGKNFFPIRLKPLLLASLINKPTSLISDFEQSSLGNQHKLDNINTSTSSIDSTNQFINNNGKNEVNKTSKQFVREQTNRRSDAQRKRTERDTKKSNVDQPKTTTSSTSESSSYWSFPMLEKEGFKSNARKPTRNGFFKKPNEVLTTGLKSKFSQLKLQLMKIKDSQGEITKNIGDVDKMDNFRRTPDPLIEIPHKINKVEELVNEKDVDEDIVQLASKLLFYKSTN